MASTPLSDASLRVRDLGEFGLIDRLQARIDARLGALVGSPGGLELSIGDDAAVWRSTAEAREVITTDALIEDVHFRRATSSWRDLGWKALAVNVSDVAAMGAQPRFGLVTLGLPADILVTDVDALYDGMLDVCERFDVRLVGGDLVASPFVVLNVTLIGDTTGGLLRRDAGQAGDLLAITGTLGASAGGLRQLEREGRQTDPRGRLLEAHLRPLPRVAEGLALARAGLLCALDVSDGLLGDAAHICERSAVGATIQADLVPIDAALTAEVGGEALSMALTGGEDYELLCAGPANVIERARAEMAALGTPLTVIGRLAKRPVAGPLVRVVDREGRVIDARVSSWDHFRG